MDHIYNFVLVHLNLLLLQYIMKTYMNHDNMHVSLPDHLYQIIGKILQ